MLGRLCLGLLVVAVLAGTASAAATKQGDPQKRHNAADQAWAQRLHIQRSDLGPGDWRVEADSGDPEDYFQFILDNEQDSYTLPPIV